MQIPKVQKKTDNLTVFFALLGSAQVKAARTILMKLIPVLFVIVSVAEVPAKVVENPEAV